MSVVEGVIEDLGHGRIPNVPAEMGIRSELTHNKSGFAKKVAVTGAVIGLGLLAANLISRRAAISGEPRRTGKRSGKSALQRNAVFGTSTPPRWVSGMIRRQAFKFSESEWAHWLMLMTATG
ncbi:hypothetical protein JNW90_26015 [Micromonospora sp. STR1s_5]|nr:hypothetical protein [Micromonospora sp. STR1s_5]